MNLILNIIWLVLGGVLCTIGYYLAGVLCCITVIGIPFGMQLFKLGTFCLCPFGKSVENSGGSPMGCLSIVMNVIWILLGWWEIALVHLACGLLCCITIIGIPLGLQHFKIALLSAMPFGRTFA